MNKKVIISVATVIILALIGGGVFWYLKTQKREVNPPVTENKPEQTQDNNNQLQRQVASSTTKDIDMSNWETYRNEEYGFEVKYPEGWELSEEYKQYNSHNVIAVKKMFVNQYGSTDGSIIKINVYSVDNKKDVREWLDKLFPVDSETSTLHKISNIKIASIEATYRTITSNVSGGYFNDVAFQNNNDIYYIEIISRILSEDQKNTEQHNSDISSILNSINFLK
ncbi:hypothetical protein A2477_03325 [Candidatus Falkowbacteria bacterium RIFOXYC2_FULL_47_12]|jgi:hypothetical protein|uniref:PsbP C-terminal domain-containing protein n=2 Tax=Candidatus Falkowiibacteriota TaxID=1752728 RepID=A0A1F5TNS4_9BACT|nr:MAG: hypothetical protein A2242_04115 [Candidatus Falkowbacteria bacterium RIFOXYA2_FULL_47_9]OGF40546.1 MAG: hypothetical protein A2477_03325 [Candidatus Falkowbacteria bacterium RIFOXYC2_FULL_47_12]